jgi:Leucine-rich repeat (LRR) protein
LFININIIIIIIRSNLSSRYDKKDPFTFKNVENITTADSSFNNKITDIQPIQNWHQVQNLNLSNMNISNFSAILRLNELKVFEIS